MLFLLVFPLEKAHKNDNQNKCDKGEKRNRDETEPIDILP